jgi:DNA repair protein RadC
MRIYEMKMTYHLIQEGPVEALTNAARVVEYMRGGFEELPFVECLYVIPLNRKNRPLGRHRLTIGTATSALAHPREILRIAILSGPATGIVLVHNHPSGDCAPSAADIQITRMVNDATRTLEMSLLDHVIIGNPIDDPLGRGYYSFREAGLV